MKKGLAIRFEIFKRDNFTCQYCGRKTPEAILELDHIIPKCKGGKNDIQNYITSCFECNRGKAGSPLDKIKTRPELKAEMYLLAEKELQLKEYYNLREEIDKRIQSEMEFLGNQFFESSQYVFAPKLARSIKYFLNIFTKYEISEAIDIAIAKFPSSFPSSNDGWDRFRYLCGILHRKKREKENES